MTDIPADQPASPARTSGWDGMPWPEMINGRPVLVVPQAPDYVRWVDPADGWSAGQQEALIDPPPGWSAELEGQHMTITRPSGAVWFKGGPLPLTREWRRAAALHRALLLITGPFATIAEFRPAASAGALCVLVIPLRRLAWN